jgi:hypothetical protein
MCCQGLVLTDTDTDTDTDTLLSPLFFCYPLRK